MLRLPVGYDMFESIIEQGFDFIDKTLFIKDVVDDEASIILLTRPRRFGKTLMLTMLQAFFSCLTTPLVKEGFKKYKIATVDDGKYMEHQGKYPVIFITLKGIHDHSFEKAYPSLRTRFKTLYSQHRYLLESAQLAAEDKEYFSAILREEADIEKVKVALGELSRFLFQHHGVKPWILIDEYDAPIQSAYLNGYYDDMINFMRDMFGTALKTNPYLNKAVITGILRISKESLFSGLNNLTVCSILNERYSSYFGFTEEEMNFILRENQLEDQADAIKRWYNGYQFGNTVIYNPWSIVNCVRDKGEIQPYWINTSGNDLVKELVINSSLQMKEVFENLLQGVTVPIAIDEHVTFGELRGSEEAVWSLLLATGYLKVTSTKRELDQFLCYLAIPNLEVKIVYRKMIAQWLAPEKSIMWYNAFLKALLTGDIKDFEKRLKEVMLQIVSVHDVAKEPEAFYHGLMLGFVAGIDPEKYLVKSNRESGYGLYDIAIIPLDKKAGKPALILELKSVRAAKAVAVITKAAETALKQINKRAYVSEIKQRGIERIIKIGLAFRGKKFKLKTEG